MENIEENNVEGVEKAGESTQESESSKTKEIRASARPKRDTRPPNHLHNYVAC